MNMISYKKNLVLAQHANNRISVKTGKSERLVIAYANSFDTKLNDFLTELDENPVFGLNQYEKFDDEESKIDHKDFADKVTAIVADWRGDNENGYFSKLNKFAYGNEIADIKKFDNELNVLINKYKDLGYDTSETLVRSGLDISAEDVSNIVAKATISSDKLDENIDTLWKDIKIDACADSYGPECEGSDDEVDKVTSCIFALEENGEIVDAKSVLTCAGIEPTEENIKKFAACIQKRKNPSGSVPRGTLAYCAVSVKRSLSIGSAHTDQAWRDKYETWMRAYNASDKNNIENYVNQYNAFRKDFIAKGGKTSSTELEKPKLIPTWVYWTVGGIVVLIFVGQIASIAKSISLLKK